MKTLSFSMAILAITAFACSDDKAPASKAKVSVATPVTELEPGPPRSEKKVAQSSDHIDAHAVFHECAPGAKCKASFTVDALKGTHLNKEYPHRFSTVEGVPLDFTSSKMEFLSEEKGTFVATFEGPDAKMPVEGTLAVSACDDKACFIEKLSFAW